MIRATLAYMTSVTRSPGMWFLVGLGAIEAVALGWAAYAGVAFPGPGLATLGAAVVAYGVAAVVATRLEDDRAVVVTIVGVAVLLRAVLLPAELRLSDDLWRYLWDGHVGAAGINPYLYAPADSTLESLRTTWHSLINNPTVPTIYGPTAQLAFRLIEALGSSVVAAKLVWVVLDLVTLGVLLRYARVTGRRLAVVGVLYGWSPLLVVETAWSGHLESLGLLCIVLLLATVHARRSVLAGVALGAAAMTKFAPLALAPVIFRTLGSEWWGGRKGWTFAAGLGGTLLIGFIPFLDAGPRMWRGLATYAEHWRFNTGLFTLVELPFTDPLDARFAVGFAVIALVGIAAWRRFDAERAVLWVLGAGVVLSPTVHPWYVLWLLPVAALRSSRAWLVLSCTVFLAYWGLDAFHRGGEWPEPGVVRLAVWLPFFGLLLADGLRAWRTRACDGGESTQREPAVADGKEQQEGQRAP